MDSYHANVEKRRYPRADFRHKVKYKLRFGDVYADHLAYDLSKGGIRIHSPEFLPLHTRVMIQIQLVKFQRMVEIEGRVAWIKYVPSLDGYQMGLEFAVDAVYQSGLIGQHVEILLE